MEPILMLIGVGILFTFDMLRGSGRSSQSSNRGLSEDEAQMLKQYRNLRDRS